MVRRLKPLKVAARNHKASIAIVTYPKSPSSLSPSTFRQHTTRNSHTPHPLPPGKCCGWHSTGTFSSIPCTSIPTPRHFPASAAARFPPAPDPTRNTGLTFNSRVLASTAGESASVRAHCSASQQSFSGTGYACSGRLAEIHTDDQEGGAMLPEGPEGKELFRKWRALAPAARIGQKQERRLWHFGARVTVKAVGRS